MLSTQNDVMTKWGSVGSCAAFVLIGALQALYGPIVSVLISKYGISYFQAGFFLSALFIGALLGVIGFNVLYKGKDTRRFISLSYLLMFFGIVVFLFSKNYFLALFATFIAGLGFGGIDFGLNYIFARGFGERSVFMINVLNAHFGIGAILGPILIGVLGIENYGYVFSGLALMLLLIMVPVRFVQNEIEFHGTEKSKSSQMGFFLVLACFLTLYVIHVAIETGVGGWMPTHLVAIGYEVGVAAAATATFWGALTLGRIIVAFVGLHVSSGTIMLASCIGMTVCLGLATYQNLALIAYIGVGLFIAPIFPTGLVWLNTVASKSQNVTAYIVAASMVGGIAFPPLIGMAIEIMGAQNTPLYLSFLSMLCVLSVLYISWFVMKKEHVATA